jgi:hypothetical protein
MEGFPLRMSGIVVGGLLGAAAAMYFNRSNRTFSFSGMSSAGQALDSMVEKARSRMMDPDKRSYYGSNASQSGASNMTTSSAMPSSNMGTSMGASNMSASGMGTSGMGTSGMGASGMSSSSMGTSNASSSNASGLERVESIVKEDPALKSQVNDILAENRDTTTIR